MTQDKRIVLNILTTYGRSLYTLAIGLCCGRWTLQALGEVSYGLWGLIGGMTVFVSFVNGLLSSAVGRFFAVAVGGCKKGGSAAEGIEECRKWFNTALGIHAVVPSMLLVMGYPVGVWMVENFLNIPADQIAQCVWVWRFTCFSCWMGMITVPFNAMYVARQEIAELTVYSFATVTINALVLYYMIVHPRDWLVPFAGVTMALSVIPQLIIAVSAWIRYEECAFVKQYIWDKVRLIEIAKFAFARFWTALSQVLGSQGMAILVNKYLGPTFNATIGVGNSVAAKASTLSGSISGAFWPVIANKVGEGDMKGMREFAFRTCKLSTIMILLFALPLLLESEEVIKLWLVKPPESSWIICCAVLASLILERMTEGYWMAIVGEGSGVSLYSAVVSVSDFAGFSVIWILLVQGLGIYGICLGMVLSWVITVVVRLYLGQKLVGMLFKDWLRQIFTPLAKIIILVMLVGGVPRYFMEESFLRVAITTLACEVVFLPLVWFWGTNKAEQQYMSNKLSRLFRKG